MGKLVIDGNKVYTVDEDCMKKKESDAYTDSAERNRGKRSADEKSAEAGTQIERCPVRTIL